MFVPEHQTTTLQAQACKRSRTIIQGSDEAEEHILTLSQELVVRINRIDFMIEDASAYDEKDVLLLLLGDGINETCMEAFLG